MPTITLDQATQLGLAVHQQLNQPDLGAINSFGFLADRPAPADDDAADRTATVAPSFDYFVSVGLLSPLESATLLALLQGKPLPEPPAVVNPGVVNLYLLLLLAARQPQTATFGFWDVISDIAEVVAGASLGFLAAGPVGAVAGGSLALVKVLGERDDDQ